MEKIISFYRFFNISDTKRLRKNMQVLCEDLNLLGTILISEEGVNGTLSGKENAIKFVLEWLRKQLGIKGSLDGRWLEWDRYSLQRRAGRQIRHADASFGGGRRGDSRWKLRWVVSHQITGLHCRALGIFISFSSRSSSKSSATIVCPQNV